jgi:predicted nuclease of predicted toxin-antitoxin system
MKLLLDENLPPALAAALEEDFPGSTHVHLCGLESADDAAIWEYARQGGFVIATKDADYEQLSMMKGFPPKVIWIRTGNCTTEALKIVFKRYRGEVEVFCAGETDAILQLR